ncbi:MAG: HNH endonuclease, partial [Bacteroidales bacterium]
STCYDEYKSHHTANTLEAHSPSAVVNDKKDLLLSLYDSKTKVIKKFREEYFRINRGTYNNLCPYCVISESNTTEHILPKEMFPEYAINVLNLIPACSKCNSLKGDLFLDRNGNRFTINFYTDSLPDIQFLFADVFKNGAGLKVEYRLNNPDNKIDNNLFELICRHYKRYDLIERYNNKAMEYLSEIINEFKIEEFENENELDRYSSKYLKKCSLDQMDYGYNHWRIVLRLGVVNSQDFKDYIIP